MTEEKKEIELLAELLELLGKYPTSVIENLARQFSDQRFSKDLSRILSMIANSRRDRPVQTISSGQKRPGNSKLTKRDYRKQLEDLGHSEKEKSEILIQLYDRLIDKSILPSLRDVQAFLSDHGVRPIKVKSRERAIIPFVKVLASLEMDKLKHWIRDIVAVSDHQDRSLEGWTKIILSGKGRMESDE